MDLNIGFKEKTPENCRKLAENSWKSHSYHRPLIKKTWVPAGKRFEAGVARQLGIRATVGPVTTERRQVVERPAAGVAADRVQRLPVPRQKVIWDRCYDFLNIFAQNFGEKIGVFDLKQR
jgi:hypothetical protein